VTKKSNELNHKEGKVFIMLDKASTLKGYLLKGLDGEIGGVKDFYFDDKHWTIRYLVVNTGIRLADRQVLISPYALVSVNKEKRQININLTKKQVEDSPSAESDKPVSKQSGPVCWEGTPCDRDEKSWDIHLHSAQQLSGFHILASDGEIGHVEDFIIDEKTWAIHKLVVDAQSILPGKKVLVSPDSIGRINMYDTEIFVNISRDAVSQLPEYTDESPTTS